MKTSIHPFFFSLLRLFPALLIVSVIIGITPFCLKAQNRVQIVHSDSIKGGTIQGRKIQKILGEVHLKTKKFNMFADSAYKFPGQNKVIAYGNIEIDTKEQSIWADTLTYYTDKDFSKLRGRVIIESDSTSLFGSSVNYHFKTEVAHFLRSIRLVDPNGVLIAQKGYFYRKADSAVFRGNVQLKDSLKYLEGDSLFSNRRTGYNELYGNVFGDDPANNSKLSGDYLQSDSAGKRIITGNAWLINYKNTTSKEDTSKTDSLLAPEPASGFSAADSTQISADDSTHAAKMDTTETSQPDTTNIFAHKIISIAHRTPKDTTTTVHAFKNVRVWSTNFSSVSDTAKYNSKAHTFELWSNAIAWHKNIQLTGPYIKVILEDGDIKKLISSPHPFTVQQDTSIDRLNQIKGDSLAATFNKGQLDLIRVVGHSHLLRFTKKEGKPDGYIEVQAPVTNIFFEKGKLDKMKSLSGKEQTTGHYMPKGKEASKKQLKGFAWNPDKRPQKPEKSMQRRLKPIPEKPPFNLPKKYLEHIHPHVSLPDSLPTQNDSLPTKSKNNGNRQEE